MSHRQWSEQDVQLVRSLYPHVQTAEIAAMLLCDVQQVYSLASRLGLTKTPEFLASPHARRIRRGDNFGSAGRFPKGHVPANKGLRRPGWAPGRMSSTQFKPGERSGIAARNWCPIGSIRADAEGFLHVKAREGVKGEVHGYGNTSIWPMVHRSTWEQVNGPVPPGHALIFKDRNRANCDLANLECVSRAELMRRNSIHNLPKELVQVIQLTGALKRKVRRKQRGTEEQTV